MFRSSASLLKTQMLDSDQMWVFTSSQLVQSLVQGWGQIQRGRCSASFAFHMFPDWWWLMQSRWWSQTRWRWWWWSTRRTALDRASWPQPRWQERQTQEVRWLRGLASSIEELTATSTLSLYNLRTMISRILPLIGRPSFLRWRSLFIFKNWELCVSCPDQSSNNPLLRWSIKETRSYSVLKAKPFFSCDYWLCFQNLSLILFQSVGFLLWGFFFQGSVVPMGHQRWVNVKMWQRSLYLSSHWSWV